jgi:hypothetical protein
MKYCWVLLLIFAELAVGLNLNLPGHNQPPPARPQRRSGGEGVPPLPLPATPLRRSEKKREPAPPVLVAKAAYTGNVYNITNDVLNLLNWAGSDLQITYRPVTIPLDRFTFDPTEIPVFYLTGHDPIPMLTITQAQKLRRYVYGGGTILANACCGCPEFAESFRRMIKSVFPDRPLHRLSPEHPIFHCFHEIADVRFQQGRDKFFTAEPLLEGIDLGCRTAVIFAPADLANGWYGQNPSNNYPQGLWIMFQDARKLGANIVHYLLANVLYARAFPLTLVQYQDQAETPNAQRVEIAQLIHQGDWDPNPYALQRLQKYLAENSTLKVEFRRKTIDPGDPAIFNFPLLYIVGHREFVLSDQQVSTLRGYLLNGGVLLAESCCGRREFDLAFRREIKRVLPDYRMNPLAADHPMYQVDYKIGEVGLSPLGKKYFPDLHRPFLEGIEINGRLGVIYSQLALANGWEGIEHPYSAGYDQTDALRLGVNIVIYNLTH